MLSTGCLTPSAINRDPASPDFKPSKRESAEITPSDAAFAERRKAAAGRGKSDSPVLTEGEVVQLPKFVVNEKGFSNYGFSIVTNEEVLRDGPVKWVQIGVVLPGSIADQHHLATGTKIVAINDVPVTELRRDELLRLLFERESGEHVRLLVLSRSLGLLPIFVDLGGPPMQLK